MKIPDVTSSLRRLAPLAAAGLLLAGCDDLTRFEQERYECGSNPDGLVEIDFREFKKGEQTTVIFTDETVTMPIIESRMLNAIVVTIRITKSSISAPARDERLATTSGRASPSGVMTSRLRFAIRAR